MDYSHTTLAKHLINVLALDQRHFNVVSKFLRRIPPWGALRACMRIYIWCGVKRDVLSCANCKKLDQLAYKTSLFAHSIKSLNEKSENCDLSPFYNIRMA